MKGIQPSWLFVTSLLHFSHDFRAASRSLSFEANPNFSKPKWVGEEVGDEGHYIALQHLLLNVSLLEVRRFGHVHGALTPCEKSTYILWTGIPKGCRTK